MNKIGLTKFTFLTKLTVDLANVGETKRRLGERVTDHTANIENNLFAVAEHYQRIGHKPDLDSIKVLLQRGQTSTPQSDRDYFHKKSPGSTLNRDGCRHGTFKDL